MRNAAAHFSMKRLSCFILPLLLATVAVPPPRARAQGTKDAAAPAAAPDEKLSDAERVTRLQRTIDADQTRLRELQDQLSNPDGPYHQAELEFKTIDEKLAQLRAEMKTEEAAASEGQIDLMEKQHKLAKDRFDVAIEERKNLLAKIATLEDKLRNDREALAKLTSPDKPLAPSNGTAGHIEAATNAAAAAAAPPAAGTSGTAPPSALPTPAAALAPATSNTTLPIPGSAPAAATAQPAATPTGTNSLLTPKAPSRELVNAQADARVKEAAAQQAQVEAKSITSRVDDLRKLIEQERKSLALARKKADLATEAEQTLERELEQKMSEGVAWSDLVELRRKIAEAAAQSQEARAAGRTSGSRLDELQSELATLHAQQIAALEDAEKSRRVAEAAQKEVERLQNPFTLENLARITFDRGPRIVGSVVGMILLLWLARLVENRLLAAGVFSSNRGTTRERENRTRTLMGVFHNAASVAIVIATLLVVLGELGINVSLLMGGAAVFGLAAAFGAQNLIRDYFYGFVILLENQYKISDVVQIGTLSGQVERITLRMTVLRDLEGTVHFIPNGQIASVSNKTHGWSRALFEIPVSYKEDVDRVMSVLVAIGKQLRDDANLGRVVLEDPTMLGVDRFSDSAMVIKFFIKTKPLQQWDVKREMLRRIKKRFDELKIEIPYPHHTVYVRPAEGCTMPAAADSDQRHAA